MATYSLEINVPVNGKVGKATVTAIDESGDVLFTDQGNLVEMQGRLRMANRVAERLGVDSKDVLTRLEAGMKDALTKHRQTHPQPATNGHGSRAKPDDVNEGADDPHRLANLFADTYRHDNFYTLRYWQDTWLIWKGGAWREIPVKDLRAWVCQAVKEEFDQINKALLEIWEGNQGADDNGKPVPKPVVRRVTIRLVNDVMQALGSILLLCATIEAPCWLDGANSDLSALDPLELLVCKNGIVHLPTLATDDRLDQHTPALFTRNALGYDSIYSAPPPSQWLGFLGSLWPNDAEAISTLQEIFGYALTNDTRQQKIFLFVGPRRSGKGTIIRVMRQVIGAANCCSPTLASLGQNFGLWPLLDKSLAFISDARLSGRTDSAIVIERLLSISGEDAQTLDRKHLSPITTKLATRFVILTNELPRLNDPSGALAGRMILLPLKESFYGREDHELTDKLLTELPGVLLWAVEGWHRLRRRGRFIQPESGRQLLEDLEDLASPIGAFIRERCLLGTGYSILVRDLFEEWKVWCNEKGRKDPGTEQVFGRDLRAALPQLSVRRPTYDGDRVRVYEGIKLQEI